jgi:hypothetical protein
MFRGRFLTFVVFVWTVVALVPLSHSVARRSELPLDGEHVEPHVLA